MRRHPRDRSTGAPHGNLRAELLCAVLMVAACDGQLTRANERDPFATCASRVVSFTLVNADTDQDLGPLQDGDTIDLASTPNLNVRANTDPDKVGSVRFKLDGNSNFSTEGWPPYVLAGDNCAGDYAAWTPAPGSHTLTATPYSAPPTQDACQPLTITFVVQGASGGGSDVVSGELKTWHPVTLSFHGPASSELQSSPNPFLDYRLQVKLDGPGGQQYDVPGFFDGDGNGGATGDVWRARFTPDQAGTWTYVASFRKGDKIAIGTAPGTSVSFDGASGSFDVASAPGATGFMKKGRLVKKNDGTWYLRTLGDNQPWIKTGADEPEQFLGYKGFDDTPAPVSLLDFAAHRQHWGLPGLPVPSPNWTDKEGDDGKGIIGALNYLWSKNVNSIYMLLMSIGGDFKNTYPFAGNIDPNGAASNDNLHYDISKLRQWNIVFDHAQRLGINLHFVLNEAEVKNKTELDDGNLGTERKLFYREMVARFAHHNAIEWNICEEYNMATDPWTPAKAFTPTQLAAFRDYIIGVDPYDHPVTVHNVHGSFSGAVWWTEDHLIKEPKWGCTSVQYHKDLPETSQAAEYSSAVETRRALSAGAKKAIFFDETLLGLPANDQSYTKIGTWGQAGSAWMRKNLLYAILFSGGGLEWILQGNKNDLSQWDSLWTYSWHARKFMEQNLPFAQMAPADPLVSGHPKHVDVLAKSGEVYAIYLPSAGSTGSLNLAGVSGTLKKRWYNPRTGQFEGATTDVTGGGSVNLGSPPSSPTNDWVLLIKRDAGGTIVLPQIGFSLKHVDSEETVAEDGAATNAFDGDPSTFWHTEWRNPVDPSHPHEIQIDLGSTHAIAGVRYLPRQGMANGRIASYELHVSADAVSWGSPASSGSFPNSAAEQEVLFSPRGGRYVKLRALSEVNGQAWTSVAELNVLVNP